MVLAHDTTGGKDGVKRTADIANDSNVAFDSMLLAPRTLEGLTAAGFTRPSPVQLQGIPTGKCGFNLLLEAKSGTGKTAVFTVIALELLDGEPDAQVLILAPTREIAAQITDVIRQIGRPFEDLTVEVVMGGLPLQEDIKKFSGKKKVQIIVGSPGRLRYLIEKNHIDINSVRLFVLDEADKLMQGSFRPDINYIFSTLPNCKQLIMSSATYPTELVELVKKYMTKYLHICPNSTSVLLGIEQRLTIVNQHSNIVTQTQNRYTELLKIFKSRQFKQCIVFCNYQARVVEVCKRLKTDKWPAQSLHGQQEQTERLHALKTLQDYKCRILVSTDLAARGIDASNVDVVINFEVPYEWATYLHRIGRAGRYGSYGLAITILAKGKEETKFIELLKSLGGPVNMRDLWTDTVVNLDANKEIVPSKIINHTVDVHVEKKIEVLDLAKSTEKLWKFIIGDDAKEMEETQGIEDFEKLVTSFENSEEMECFADLLNSYENSNVTNTNTVFKTLKINYEHGDNTVQSNTKCVDENNKPISCENSAGISYKMPSLNLLKHAKKRNTAHTTPECPKKNDNSKNEKGFSHANSNNCNRINKCLQNGTNQAVDHKDHTYDDTYENKNMFGKGTKNSKGINSSKNNRISNAKPDGKTTVDDSDEYVYDYGQEDHSCALHNGMSWKPASTLDSKRKLFTNNESQPQASDCDYESRSTTKKYNGNYSSYSKNHEQKSCSVKSESNTDTESDEVGTSSGSETDSSSECDSSQDSDCESVRWSLTSEEGKRLYGTLQNHENIVRTAYKITAAKSYEAWKRQLALRKAQIQMAVYVKEIGKLNRT